uniref:solute carrier family 25 member 44-like n=1 Tax=Erigeron canadensis TaxID=72917 RepID=UPI001CB935EB|nr:solute carrier family 25 member 44-like [Erigeron canadensis]
MNSTNCIEEDQELSISTSSSADDDQILVEEIEWKMLDKTKFLILGAGLFSCVSAALYPVVVLKTRQQVVSSSSPPHHHHLSSTSLKTILRYEGLRGLYRGFGTSLIGTVPARALYMTALEVTKSNVGTSALELGFPEPTAAAIANAMAGLTAALAAQLVWTPIDVVTQRLMVQGSTSTTTNNMLKMSMYVNGINAFRKIMRADGPRGLYRGFGISVLTYAPSNAVWWASYSVAQRLVWGGVGSYLCRKYEDGNGVVALIRPDATTVMAVQGVSAAMAGGVSALVTMPLDTIKTRLQVLDSSNDDNNARKGPSVGQTVRILVREGGWMAFYRGLGPRWASMSMSATTMITTYEFLKRLSTKSRESLT